MLISPQKPKTLTDNISSRVKVRVTKKEPDALKLLCGEHVQTEPDGTQFFIIPAHQGERVKEMFVKYEVGEEFLPDEEIEKLRTPKVVPEVKAEHHGDHHEKKVRGNPNWKKKETSDPGMSESGDSD
jgi:hypothetical protein